MISVILSIGILILGGIIILQMQKARSGELSRAEETRKLQEALEAKINAYGELSNRLLKEQQEWSEKQSRDMRESTLQEINLTAEQNLRKQSEALRATNQREMEILLNPLKSKLDEFSKAVNQAYMNENATRRSLTDQITLLMELNRNIGKEAHNLTTALKGDSKVQGDWGESLLQTLLESAGLVKDVHFFIQVTTDDTGKILTDETGRRQRPDVVVNLTDGHRMIIDSKVSLTAYTRYVAAETDEERKREGKQHVSSVKKHIDELGSKQYQKQIRDAADHVLMFMPIEGAYYAAMQIEPELWSYAFERNVAIVSPTHLFSVMQLVNQLWNKEKQERNAEEIARQGGLLYDRVAAFLNEFETLGNSLDTARSRFDHCKETLTKGRQSVVARSERLRELGTPVKRRISSSMTDQPDDNEGAEENG